MIRVNIKQNKEYIIDVTIKGHANSDEHGKDLVCAGVSASSIGIINALVHYGFLEQNMGTIVMKDGYIHIIVNEYNKVIQVILETLEITLKTIQESNEEFIKITKAEV